MVLDECFKFSYKVNNSQFWWLPLWLLHPRNKTLISIIPKHNSWNSVFANNSTTSVCQNTAIAHTCYGTVQWKFIHVASCLLPDCGWKNVIFLQYSQVGAFHFMFFIKTSSFHVSPSPLFQVIRKQVIFVHGCWSRKWSWPCIFMKKNQSASLSVCNPCGLQTRNTTALPNV